MITGRAPGGPPASARQVACSPAARGLAAQRRIGHDAHVDSREPAQQAHQQRAFGVAGQQPTDAAPRRWRAHQQIGAPERARHLDHRVGHVLALLHSQARTERGGQPAQRLQALAILLARRAARRAHDEHVELGVQALGRAPRAPHDALGLRRERRQREQPLGDRLGTGLGGHREALLVAPQQRAGLAHQALDLDVLGDLAQRDLAQRGEVLDLEEVVQRRRHALGAVHLARAQARDQRLRRQVDQHDLVR